LEDTVAVRFAHAPERCMHAPVQHDLRKPSATSDGRQGSQIFRVDEADLPEEEGE